MLNEVDTDGLKHLVRREGMAAVLAALSRVQADIEIGQNEDSVGTVQTDLVKRVGAALQAACRKEFNSSWCNDVAWKFARAAIDAVKSAGFDPPDEVVTVALTRLQGHEWTS